MKATLQQRSTRRVADMLAGEPFLFGDTCYIKLRMVDVTGRDGAQSLTKSIYPVNNAVSFNGDLMCLSDSCEVYPLYGHFVETVQ